MPGFGPLPDAQTGGNGAASDSTVERTMQRLARVGARAISAVEKRAYAVGLLSTKRLPLPDFLGIGFMKTGTTWLYENLRCHPELHLADAKELRYFDTPRYLEPLARYAGNFQGANGRLKGEISPSYALVPERRVQEIRRLLPDVRLLVLLRDPVEREWSRVTHAYRKDGRDIREAADEEVMAILGRGTLASRGGYSGTIEKWLRHFPADRLFVGFYEDLQARPQGLLTDVFAFLGVDTDVDWERYPYGNVIVPPNGPEFAEHDQGRGVAVDEGYENSNVYFPERYREVLLGAYRDELRALKARFGDAIDRWPCARQLD